jgi:hypothetical protein
MKRYDDTPFGIATDPVGKFVLWTDAQAEIDRLGKTARHFGCRSIGIDLNAKYLDVAARRVTEPPRWWLRQQKPKKAKRKVCLRQGSLFA